jgi:hypothetical protein
MSDNNIDAPVIKRPTREIQEPRRTTFVLTTKIIGLEIKFMLVKAVQSDVDSSFVMVLSLFRPQNLFNLLL